MSDRLDLDQQTDRAVRGLVTCADHLERLTYFLSRLLRQAPPDGAPRDRAALDAPLQKLERAARALRTYVQHDPGPLDLGSRCAQRMMEHLDGHAPPAAEPAGDCVLSGRSPGIEVTEVLELLSTHRRTGTLHVRTMREAFTLEIVGGDIVHAVSDAPPPEQRLGNILVERGALDAETLERFLRECGRSSRRMGEALQSGAFVGKDDLTAALAQQVQELFHRLFSSADTMFSFYTGGAALPELRIRMNVVQLLLESARNFDESSSLPAATAARPTERA